MKKLLSVIVAFVAITLFGCLDSQEDITIKSDGSGTYRNTIDMSGMFDMLQMAAMMDTSANSAMKALGERNIDSLISMRSFTDTATNLTAEEKALMRDATMQLKVNQAERVFKVVMNYPFKKTEDIEKILALQQSGKGFANPFDPGKAARDLPNSDAPKGDMPSADALTKVVFKKGLIERKIDEAKLAEFKNSDNAKEMGQAEMMLSQVKFSTAIRLPNAATSVKGERAILSDDKKTVLIKYTMSDMLNNPKSLEYKIQY